MSYGELLVTLIDEAVAREEEDEFRNHLGASIIGKKCLREIYFTFRWADREPFPGRLLRLFNRGHREELVFTELLQKVGARVYTQDENGKQFKVTGCHGHFGGSLDGVATHLPQLDPTAAVLLEMKTHNDKWFKLLQKKGLKDGHPKHWKQAQVYARGMNLKWCLYCAVNKNDDQLWFDLFPIEEEVSTHLLNRAETVIFGEGMPPRISENPSWHECRFCAMRGVCFGYSMPRQNCRTCVYSAPQRDGTWACSQGRPEIRDTPRTGCEQHRFIPELLPNR